MAIGLATWREKKNDPRGRRLTLMQADAHTRTSLAGRERNPWPGEGGSATPKENGFWRMLPRFSRDCVPIAQVSAASHACSVPRWVSLQESPWRTGGREFAYFALKGNKCEKSNPVPDCWDTLTARGCNTVATSFEQSAHRKHARGVHSKFRFPSLAMHHRQREGTDSTRPRRRVRRPASASRSRLALARPSFLPLTGVASTSLESRSSACALASRGTSGLTRQQLQTPGIWRPRLTNCRCCASRPISPALLARA
ncbi:hypothetical protein J3E74DRAFT_471988 [Bipolaris maydis]|nr:hypothetical protein J3E73DRAFT_428200 [Bipolaris maydis]KAJ5064592.1 hypothetical protein J3E74DRAFT_471988 [Bipolaris maydis]